MPGLWPAGARPPLAPDTKPSMRLVESGCRFAVFGGAEREPPSAAGGRAPEPPWLSPLLDKHLVSLSFSGTSLFFCPYGTGRGPDTNSILSGPAESPTPRAGLSLIRLVTSPCVWRPQAAVPTLAGHTGLCPRVVLSRAAEVLRGACACAAGRGVPSALGWQAVLLQTADLGRPSPFCFLSFLDWRRKGSRSTQVACQLSP